MAKKTFGALTGDLGRKAGFIREEWGVTARLKEFDPASLVKEVAAVLAIDASQEGKKGEKTERGEDAREAMRKAFETAGPIVDELHAGIKRIKRPALLKALPKLNADFTFEAKIGALKAIAAFIDENPGVAKKIDKSEVAALRKATDLALAAKTTADDAGLTLPATTRTLQERSREAALRITAALDILQGTFTLLGDKAGLLKVEAIRAARGSKSAAKLETTPPEPTAKS